MSRHFGIPNVTRSPAIGGNPPVTSPYSANTRAESNSFAGATPSRVQHHLAVVRGSPFIQREREPVEPFDPGFDHREFAVYIALSCFGVSVGVLLAAATALLDWSF